MRDENVRHLWSDAELDEALAALHPHRSADRTEFDRARASLMRAADAESDSADSSSPPRKTRTGAWRWIAVAAAVIVVTGGVVVAREISNSSTTVAPAGPQSSTRVAGAPFTHVVNEYTGTVVVNGRTAFSVPQRVDWWIPSDPSGLWKRRWTRMAGAQPIGGVLRAVVDQPPEPATLEETGPGGHFAGAFPYPSPTLSTGWYRPDPTFIDSLPLEANKLIKRIMTDMAAQGSHEYGPLAQPETYGAPQRDMRFPYQSATGMILSVLASGQAPAPLRAALISAMGNPDSGFHRSSATDSEFISVSGWVKLIATVDRRTNQLVEVQALAMNQAYGFQPGTRISSAKYTYEITNQPG
ncbi:hypothetical protein [Amycolatopsis jejuensis]|uniref:hypothetical protein n=1 Tax=Amycolatopsis jejuensis TaxID=330084 RepID=UPI00052438E3|nr:hypothetical protein [Amycolatopsis jejuensis]